MEYSEFLHQKTHFGSDSGFEPLWIPDILFDFQKALTEWAIRKGRAAIFADCGLGKTFMQLVWAENVVRKIGGRILILAPLAVAPQTIEEGIKIGVDVVHRREGIKHNDRIVVTNYERMHYFNTSDFTGIVLDESSILKSFTGKYRVEITNAWKGKKYKLCCTATPAPNDIMEIGNHSEFLDVMRGCEMLSSYFINDPSHVGHYRVKGHAEKIFWKWVASWAAYIRFPSDIGYDDNEFKLPELIIKNIILDSNVPIPGMLFPLEAKSLKERQAARRATTYPRVEQVAEIANACDRPFIAWCDMNPESAALKKMIKDSVEVKGSDSETHKTQSMIDFKNGKIKCLVSKPSIAGWGMNFQHCADMAFTGLSDSYEQYYQAIRRCWRFGQTKTVNCHIVTDVTEGAVVQNIRRKERDAAQMAEGMRLCMKEVMDIGKVKHGFVTEYNAEKEMEVPSWLLNV